MTDNHAAQWRWWQFVRDADGSITQVEEPRALLMGLTRRRTWHPDQMIASGAAYNLNGQMLSATIQGVAHAWVYNSRGQMTRESAGTLMDFEYTFSATQNDGRVTRRKDYVSGEDVTYLYDSLGRLTQATGTGVAWSQSFTHDGFGNLTQRSGSGTPLSVTVNAKNQVTGGSYDANGNQTAIGTHGLSYDFENRLVSVSNVAGIGTEAYGYSVRGERLLVEHMPAGNSTPNYRELRFYDTNSQLLGAFEVRCAAPCAGNGNAPYYPVEKADKRRVYFAGKLISFGGKMAVTDRLGSLIATQEGVTVKRYRYYPYGEAIGTQEWDKPQFATYTRDGSSGLDDAMNRQYDRIWGRFTAAEPYQASAGVEDPGSWNRYSYVGGDPVNYHDPNGLARLDDYHACLFRAPAAEFSWNLNAWVRHCESRDNLVEWSTIKDQDTGRGGGGGPNSESQRIEKCVRNTIIEFNVTAAGIHDFIDRFVSPSQSGWPSPLSAISVVRNMVRGAQGLGWIGGGGGGCRRPRCDYRWNRLGGHTLVGLSIEQAMDAAT